MLTLTHARSFVHEDRAATLSLRREPCGGENQGFPRLSRNLSLSVELDPYARSQAADAFAYARRCTCERESKRRVHKYMSNNGVMRFSHGLSPPLSAERGEKVLENAKRARGAAVLAARAGWRSSAAGASIVPASAVVARKIFASHLGWGVRGRAARAVPRQCSTWIAPFWGRPIDGSAAFKTASHVIDCYALIGNSAARAVAGPRPGQHPGNFGLPIGPSGPISGPCMRAGRSAGLRRRPVALRRSWRGWRAIGGR